MKIDKVRAIFCIYFTGNCEFRSVNNSTRDRAISTEYRIIVVAVTFAFFFFFNKLVQLSHDLESCLVATSSPLGGDETIHASFALFWRERHR